MSALRSERSDALDVAQAIGVPSRHHQMPKGQGGDVVDVGRRMARQKGKAENQIEYRKTRYVEIEKPVVQRVGKAFDQQTVGQPDGDDEEERCQKRNQDQGVCRRRPVKLGVGRELEDHRQFAKEGHQHHRKEEGDEGRQSHQISCKRIRIHDGLSLSLKSLCLVAMGCTYAVIRCGQN